MKRYQTSFLAFRAARAVGLLSSSVAAQSAPPAPPIVPGPLPTIICPVGAVDIYPGTSIPQLVNLHDGGTGRPASESHADTMHELRP